MESNWAADNLQVIRTLMERSAIYRRALGPIMIATGTTGVVAAAVGMFLKIESLRGFTSYWIVVCAVALGISFLLARRQALKDAEPFWSPPTRRVAQAMLPCLFLGAVATVPFALIEQPHTTVVWSLITVWIGLYGCAVFSAGFFMPRGMKFFGWIFILSASAMYLTHASVPHIVQPPAYAHLVMGFFFGVLHIVYGVYLQVTEKRKNAA